MFEYLLGKPKEERTATEKAVMKGFVRGHKEGTTAKRATARRAAAEGKSAEKATARKAAAGWESAKKATAKKAGSRGGSRGTKKSKK